MPYELHEVKNNLRAEKRNHTYDELEDKYGVNRYYLWCLVKDEDVYLPPLVKLKLGMSAPMEVEIDEPMLPGAYLPATTLIKECVVCSRLFYRTSNAQKKCRKDCRK